MPPSTVNANVYYCASTKGYAHSLRSTYCLLCIPYAICRLACSHCSLSMCSLSSVVVVREREDAWSGRYCSPFDNFGGQPSIFGSPTRDREKIMTSLYTSSGASHPTHVINSCKSNSTEAYCFIYLAGEVSLQR